MIDRKVRAHQRDAGRRRLEHEGVISSNSFEVDGSERDAARRRGEGRLVGVGDRRRTSERGGRESYGGCERSGNRKEPGHSDPPSCWAEPAGSANTVSGVARLLATEMFAAIDFPDLPAD